MYLGPVVAAQQVLDRSPQTSYPRKEKKGAHPLQPSLQDVKMLQVRSFFIASLSGIICIKDLSRLSLISC